MAKRQQPKKTNRKASRTISRLRVQNTALRRANRRDQRTTITGGSASGSYPADMAAATPGYPVPLGQSQYPAPLPGTSGTTELAMPTGYQGGDYSWSPEGERHAVTTNQEPEDSWPPVDIPQGYGPGFMAADGPIDNGQANPQTTYGQSADLDTSQYYDYDEEPY